MKRSELQRVMADLDFHPGRNLGQNFLTDENLLEYIVRLAEVKPGEKILEVGPGFGALTKHLLDAGAEVTAVEFDYRLAEWLEKHFADRPNFTLIHADACKVDYEKLYADTEFRLVANLPYSISTPLIMTLIAMHKPPTSLTMMLQKEVGERLAAVPRTKSYGAVSVSVQQSYTAALERIVPPEVFLPKPEVDSALVTLKARTPFPSFETRRELRSIVKQAFAQRRKKMSGVLGRQVGRDVVEQILESIGIRADARPEMLTADDFAVFVEKYTAALKG